MAGEIIDFTFCDNGQSCLGERERETERDRDRERQTDRETETDRQTDRKETEGKSG